MRKQEFEGVHGLYFEDIETGMSASFEKVVSEQDVEAFAGLSGDWNPLHLDEEFARHTRAGERVVHGMATASLISTLVGCKLPGPGCLWMGQTLKFLKPVRAGDLVCARAEVVETIEGRQRIRMRTTCRVGDTTVVEGEALVWVPLRASGGPWPE